jgi:hypothetical protein
MISEAAEDAFREWWRASIPREFRARLGSPIPAPRGRRPKPPAYDHFEDFLREMAAHCGTGSCAKLSGPELMAYPGMQPVFERHQKLSLSEIRHWFAPRHGKPYGGYVLRRIAARKRYEAVRWFVDRMPC